MTNQNTCIAPRFYRLVAGQKNLNPNSISATASFVDDLGFDSLDSVELAMNVEKEFDIKVTEADEERLSNVSQYVAFIEQAIAPSVALGLAA